MPVITCEASCASAGGSSHAAEAHFHAGGPFPWLSYPSFSWLPPTLATLWTLKPAAGHLQWKLDCPPSQSVGSGFEPQLRIPTS